MAKIIKGPGGSPTDDLIEATLDDAPRRRVAVVSKEDFEAQNDARKIVADAEVRAQGIVAEAQAEAERILQKAQADGVRLRAEAQQQGFKEGSDQAAAQYVQAIAEHSKRMESKENEVALQVRQLSLAIAKKLIGNELQFNPDAILDMAKKHLASIRQRREVYMRVSPSDLEHLREHKRELIDQLGRAKEIEIRADEALSPGSIVIETEAGSIDARIETQLAVIERILMGSRKTT